MKHTLRLTQLQWLDIYRNNPTIQYTATYEHHTDTVTGVTRTEIILHFNSDAAVTLFRLKYSEYLIPNHSVSVHYTPEQLDRIVHNC